MNNEDHSSELCEVKQMMLDLQRTVEDTMCTTREEIRSQNERIVELINTVKITSDTREEIRTILKDLKDDIAQVKTEIERKNDIEQRQRTPSEGEISEDVLDFNFEELPSSKPASDTKQKTHEIDPKPVEEEVPNNYTNFREDTAFLEWRRRDILSQMESLEQAIKMSHRTPRRCFAYDAAEEKAKPLPDKIQEYSKPRFRDVMKANDEVALRLKAYKIFEEEYRNEVIATLQSVNGKIDDLITGRARPWIKTLIEAIAFELSIFFGGPECHRGPCGRAAVWLHEAMVALIEATILGLPFGHDLKYEIRNNCDYFLPDDTIDHWAHDYLVYKCLSGTLLVLESYEEA
ncbi:hypothetical protein Q1695_004325 [Nippostrongylus brasiliensis]|nr:hypothetical protein Q1695_004325 [Nippostrongylus brasiliensis]